MGAKIETMIRRDIPEYPEVALREVLVNAVTHADYSLTGMRIMVAIYDDRMEIQNPGMLPFGMTLDDLKAGVSKLRNRVIARVMGALNMVESWGSGYRRVVDACLAGGYPEPEWLEMSSAFRVVFRPYSEPVAPSEASDVPVNVPVNSRQEWLIEQLSQGVDIKPAIIVEQWDVTEKTAKRDIAYL
jgi:ATP-dependent DNA helicase RecG